MLDELVQIDAVERLPDQRVRPKSRIPVLTGLTSGAIESVGERTRDLLDTLTYNLRRKSKPLFEGTALIDETDRELVSLFRREIAQQGANFISGANALLNRSRVKLGRQAANSSTKCRLGVTVYYFQDAAEDTAETTVEVLRGRRKNLQRQRRSTVGKSTTNTLANPRARP
jgi:hypothetical protein